MAFRFANIFKLNSHLKPVQHQTLIRGKSKQAESKTEGKTSCQQYPYVFQTMDDMPVPCGSWKEHNCQRNNYYNKVLAFGFVSLAAALYVLKKNVFSNCTVPPYPFDNNREESEDD
ncbi:uncharacterized protein LOC126837877 [Adelges cooleyi]|uniref:uncharacterized protein LOC126837877 n=1 Tax=Adelges cooleyi TaxID=133065 RepID=UPI00217F24E0|nr:uncharacterized protein LOC126837877 [Adelges cooleyi]